MIRGTSRGSLRTSTMSPASTATSVPAPMAIPTSAVTSAGASLTPSPTIATRLPCAWSASILLALFRRQHLRQHLVHAQFRSYSFRDRTHITGDHDHLDVMPM